MGYAPGVGTGYTSVGDYLDANQGTLARERDDVNQGLNGQLSGVQAAANPVAALQPITGQPASDQTTLPGYSDVLGKTTAYNDQLAALGSHGGVADYFQKNFGDTRDQGGFDASLFGYAHPQPFDLSGYLDAHRPAPPPSPPEHEPNLPPGERRPSVTPDYGTPAYRPPGGGKR